MVPRRAGDVEGLPAAARSAEVGAQPDGKCGELTVRVLQAYAEGLPAVARSAKVGAEGLTVER